MDEYGLSVKNANVYWWHSSIGNSCKKELSIEMYNEGVYQGEYTRWRRARGNIIRSSTIREAPDPINK